MPRSPQDVDDDTLRLLTARGMGAATTRALLSHLGSPRAVVEATARELAEVPHIGARTATALRDALDRTDPAGEREALQRVSAQLVLRGDADYPALLADLPSAPHALWIRGRLLPDDAYAVAVVGSRRCSAYGRLQAARFAGGLAACGFTIVSGGALGIDGEAHHAALRAGGRTLAVLGCGVGVPYPARHAPLFERIAGGGGALLSEYPTRMPPRSKHFPRRNRIISGLGLGVLVIEAASRSGALITARIAAEEHGREVMAVPGRLDDRAAAGCLHLLQTGSAGLVTSPLDVLRQLDMLGEGTRVMLQQMQHPAEGDDALGSFTEHDLTDEQQTLLRFIRRRGQLLTLEEVCEGMEREPSGLLGDLTALEVRGLIVREAGGVREG